MKRFKSIMLLIALLVCAAVLFGCANEAPAKGSVPAGDEIEKETAADVEKEKDEAADKAPEETTAKPEETTATPAETTAKPAETTAAPKPVETTAKPVETAKPKPVETTAKPVETAKPKPVETTAAPVVEDPYASISKVEKPSDKLIADIEKDYNDLYGSDMTKDPKKENIQYVKRYYGTYNGAVPCFFRGSKTYYLTWIVEQTIAGSDFFYSDGNVIEVWKDGKFYYLEEAYEQGILTKEQIAEIAYIHKKGLYYEFQLPF